MLLISDLKNKFTEIWEAITTSDSPIFLTKKVYVTMVIMSIKQYSSLTDTF
ncbi:type II toxin-antitoxin system Phd/YefM family antitoxin [Lachnoanaerobaculum sp. ICM7]|uniref:type II toxin-antitoxin system Phd/YefM family antitoxin n=1 Tax=Lachnoanaerobaculum sp. ICM7 TaxID=936594 RepID=UPI003FA4932C